jgi:hypothetical protein
MLLSFDAKMVSAQEKVQILQEMKTEDNPRQHNFA